MRRLNKLMRWVQRHPKRLKYNRLVGGGRTAEAGVGPTHLKIVSDAAFKKETEKGHCLRGALFLRAPGNDSDSFCKVGSDITVHVFDWTCKKQRHVTRGTFAAELFSAGDAVDQGLLLSQLLHEISYGAAMATEARQQRITGKFQIPQVLYIDAMSVFAAVTAVFIKTPAEKSLLCHVQFLRELLDYGVLAAIVWLDTRDMHADGLTKGAVPRDALLKLLDGLYRLSQEPRIWRPKVLLDRE